MGLLLELLEVKSFGYLTVGRNDDDNALGGSVFPDPTKHPLRALVLHAGKGNLLVMNPFEEEELLKPRTCDRCGFLIRHRLTIAPVHQ